MAYAQAFLTKEKKMMFPLEKTDTLKSIFKDFVYVCSDALELNGTLITTEQKEYHESLAAGFQDIVDKLSEMLEEKVKVVLKSLIINQFASCNFLMHLYTENFFSIL
eukprot:XP_019918274.1 PREDICTED: dedicator of cytokinesis protein 11-like isoform X1 [Crassostrea gigas]